MEAKILRNINVSTNNRTIKINLKSEDLYGKKVVKINIEGIKMEKPKFIPKDSDDIPRDFRPKNIWEMYKNFHQGDRVVRSGNYLCGVYRMPENPADNDYIESDTEHATSCEELARNIFRFYPDLFSNKDQERICNFLRYHDLGEFGTGDRPDDGSCDRTKKFTDELSVFCDKIQFLPVECQEELIRDFIIFENALSPAVFLDGLANDVAWSDDDLKVMQFAKLCDKTDAPLHALLYELEKRPGDLNFKKEYFDGLTKQDQGYINEIDDSSQAAVWTAHFMDHYRYYNFFLIFFSIIVEAFKDVRGTIPAWLVDFCINHKICSGIFIDIYFK